MEKQSISTKTVYRLSQYSRCLKRLLDKGNETVSSSIIAAAAGVKPSQLRKDLSVVGQIGTRGLGYPVEGLYHAIREVLGQEQLQPVVLVGAGNLGRALLRYEGFKKEGFEVIAAFDASKEVRERAELPCPIYPDIEMATFVLEHNVKMAILCVPGEYGQDVANKLIASGVQGILNFSPVVLKVPEEIMINNVDLAMELENLSFFVAK